MLEKMLAIVVGSPNYNYQERDPMALVLFIGAILVVTALVANSFKKKCDNCGKEFRKSMMGTIVSPLGNFCCRRCEQEFRSREADIRHKEVSAGKGSQYTTINRRIK